MTKADQEFAKKLKEVIKGFNRIIGKEMCKELDADCLACQTRQVIGVLNHWIDLLEWKRDKKIK